MKKLTNPIWEALSDARVAIEEAMTLLAAVEEDYAANSTSVYTLRDYGVYVYRDPELKRSDPNSIVYVGNGKGDRPWQPHSNAIADGFEMTSNVEVLIDGLDGKRAEEIEYHLIAKHKPKYNLTMIEPGITPQAGCDGPWRIVAFQDGRQVGETKKTNTPIGTIEALYSCSYGNKYSNGGSPFPYLEAGVDYDSIRIRIG